MTCGENIQNVRVNGWSLRWSKNDIVILRTGLLVFFSFCINVFVVLLCSAWSFHRLLNTQALELASDRSA